MFKKLFVIILLAGFMPGLASASKITTSDPKEYAVKLSDQVVAIIQSKESESAREDKLVDLFKANVDTDWMGRFVMGRFFRQATPAQQKKYLSLYRDYVIYSYIPKFRLYNGERMNVNQTINEGDDLYLIKTTLKTDKSSTGSVIVDYKLKKDGGTFKIIDVIGEGVSLITTQRSDFSVPLNDQGIDAFISKLEEKVTYLKTKKPDTKLKVEQVSKK